MRRTMSGEKRARDTRDQETDNEDFKFISGLSLSQHPVVQQRHLFMKKFNNIVKTKSLHPKEFEGYTIRERFERMGWEQLLSFNCEKIYKRVVIQWTSSLSRNGDELTGIVDGKSYTVTPAIIRDFLKVDTRTDVPYSRFNEADFQTTTDETNRRWNEACKTVFGLIENVRKGFGGYQRFKMTPLVQILWRIGLCSFHPRLEDMNCVLAREIYLLHSLFSGDYLYSFAHLMIDDIWDMYEDKNRQNIPHGSYISEILKQYGAVSEHEYSETVPPQHRIISRSSFVDLKFSESATEYILDDRVTEQRVTFPKKVIHEEASPPLARHWMPMPNPYMDITQLLTNLQTISKQSSESQKQHNELILMFRNIALEAEHREQERDKQAKERERLAEKKEREREKRAEMKEREREKRAEEKEQEREKRSDEKEQEREKRAEEKEQEREKRAAEKEQERQKRADEKEQEREKRVEQKEQEREKQAEQKEQEREKHAEKKELEIEKRAEKKELERQKRAEEKQKLTEDREQDRVRQAEEREKHAKERERKAEERVKQAEGREHERDRVAEERERQAEIRAHAIIWDIERQRFFYEQDQEQLRMSWNQVNVANEVNEFQFPQICHTSFHPPPEGSRYYDPTHGNEIPKAFQSLYHDIFGPKP